MSVRANLVLVGAPFEDDQGDDQVFKEAGAAYLYTRKESGYLNVARLGSRAARSKSLFGYSTAFGERFAIIGAPAEGTAPGRIGTFELRE